ncbi:MAG: AgmX/PglI C-terminal domain-containing protein [Archangium sp.]
MFVSVMVGWVVTAAPVLSVDGGLPAAWVSEVVDVQAANISGCLAPPPAKSSVRYELSIAPDGKTRFVLRDVKNVDPKRLTCVGSVIDRLAFPSVDAGTAVSWLVSPWTAADAGTPGELLFGPADVPDVWATDVGRCYRTHAGVAEGRAETELLFSAQGFVLDARRVAFPDGEDREALEACVRAATRAWRLEPGTRRIVLAAWVVARSTRSAKKFFTPGSPAVEIVQSEFAPFSATSGGLPKDVIADVIRRGQKQVRACYELARKRDARAAGKVAVTFQIGPDGAVFSAEVSDDSVRDERLGACVVDVVKHWQFPRPEGGGNVKVTFPWIFTSADADD